MGAVHLRVFTPEQRKARLETARLARKSRSELIKTLRTDTLHSFHHILTLAEERNPLVKKLKVTRVLKNIPGIGRVTTQKILDTNGISAKKNITGLTAGQRDRLNTTVTQFITHKTKNTSAE